MSSRKTVHWITLISLLLFLPAAMTACRQNTNPTDDPAAGPSGTLDIVGSDTMVNLGAALAEAYMSLNEDADLVVQGGGSGTGLAALLNGNANIAQMSRAMKDDEWKQAEDQGIEVTEIIVAHDAVVVAVHPDNPVTALTVEQLGAIYRGEITNWSEVGGTNRDILLLSRDTTSGTHVFFKDMVVREDGKLPTAEYDVNALFLPSTQAIVDELVQNPYAIGYIGIGYHNPDTLQVMAIKLEESPVPISPLESHPDGLTYPLSRPLFFYVAGEMEGLVEAYLDFVLSAEGQAVVLELDFLPVR